MTAIQGKSVVVRRQQAAAAASSQHHLQESSLVEAKSRFVTAVTEGMKELMQQCGYSRERATLSLLREIGQRGDYAPSDNDQVRRLFVLCHVCVCVCYQGGISNNGVMVAPPPLL